MPNIDFSPLETAIKAANKERATMIRALNNIFHHAYDDDTPIEDLCADFDEMREIARVAIVAVTGKEAV